MVILLRKGVYPYDYADCMNKLNETSLPPKESFYSKLTGEGITDEDYQHAQKVWKEFNIESMKDYHNLYNLSDVLWLADIFENCRSICMNRYRFDPAWYFSAPGLAWDAVLQITKDSSRIIKRSLHVVNDRKWYQRRNCNNITPPR